MSQGQHSHRLRQLPSYVAFLLVFLAFGARDFPTRGLQAQQRQEIWFQTQNILSSKFALQDTTLRPRQASRKYEDTIYELHGELLLPSQADPTLSHAPPVPAIVFLVGSGPNSTHTGLYTDFVRENIEQLFFPYGVAIMYFDKRGVGLSEGRWQRTDLYERTDDARAAVEFLRKHPRIDPERIGVIGHSQGGSVAQILGHLYGDPLAFIASLGAPTYNTEQRLRYEYYNRFLCAGETEVVALDKAQKKALSDLNWVQAFPLTKTWRHLSELSHLDLSQHLAQLQTPAYFAFAELDFYVSAKFGVKALEEADLATDSNHPSPIIQIDIFPGLDHDFKPTSDLCTGAQLDVQEQEVEGSENKATQAPAYSPKFQRQFQQFVLGQLGVQKL